MNAVEQDSSSVFREIVSPAKPAKAGARLRVDGKFFDRCGQRLRIRGVTYGPFIRDADGEPFPSRERVGEDFAAMDAAGINAVRTYHVPPDWLLDITDEQGINVLIDVPWPKHLCFLDSSQAQLDAHLQVQKAARSTPRLRLGLQHR
jgi:hypothetical protein